ncbi:GNAT family N-acetyltransferase [Sphingomonas sp. KR1UV-12]|uniref:GNAT family N-acetyltransferase n=1 Tax=Sphingomonas aurea TaxID=3063994 RepID=A0ABT9ELM4_9SPHN|nr:GNAT family N-acetyltransferase [Sphingomonas sp. KR1UV-12]MDP1027854.1 GNAT family N-acetyltransferase [Sphingomonas sp. KR1UV-12]
MTATISDDRALLDFDRIHRWLTTSYWSPGIDRATVERAAANSRCVGAYAPGGQVGFARLITDGATFGWLADVVVDEDARGQGIGRSMVRHLIEAPDLAGIRRIMLNTLDAHGVYAALGFAAPIRPDFLMERLGPGAAERLRAL